ncbi:MAG: fumarylacetoacetate hydrolase family protein [Chitinophagales bacterium]|jgi:acylpyruvate hydrolase|nr:fumarylacetoacetate hydrolase family protein [Chitinophagales bacterium]
MKIICIGRNYSEHAKELKNEIPDKPVVFLKPQTALLKDNKPFYYPEWTSDLHYETEVVLKVCKQGKYVDEKFAHKYFEEVTVGIDFTARDIQSQQKAKGLPWEIAKAFDNSAVIGSFVKLTDLGDHNSIAFSMKLNGVQVQQGNTADMMFSFEKIIAYASQFFTLQTGDLIFTGTPAGVGPVKIGDRLQGFIGTQPLFDFEVK